MQLPCISYSEILKTPTSNFPRFQPKMRVTANINKNWKQKRKKRNLSNAQFRKVLQESFKGNRKATSSRNCESTQLSRHACRMWPAHSARSLLALTFPGLVLTDVTLKSGCEPTSPSEWCFHGDRRGLLPHPPEKPCNL